MKQSGFCREKIICIETVEKMRDPDVGHETDALVKIHDYYILRTEYHIFKVSSLYEEEIPNVIV